MNISTLKKFKEEIVDKGFDVNQYLCIVNPSQIEVSFGSQNDINIKYCKKHNIPCYNLNRDGGCIIHFVGNICWAEIKPNNTKDFKYTNLDFLEKLTIYLQEKGINAVQDNNDILVDNFKVASGCAINLEPDFTRTFSAVQINVNCDTELIEQICTKPMKKIPKALSEYGITTEEMFKFVENYFS